MSTFAASATDNGPLTVEFGDGDAAEYDLVIGADGIHNSVRALTFGTEAAARPVGQVGWRFVADCPTQVTTWSVMLGHRSAFLTLPIGDGRVYCYCDVIPSSPDPHDHLDQIFSAFAEPVPAILDTLPRWGPPPQVDDRRSHALLVGARQRGARR